MVAASPGRDACDVLVVLDPELAGSRHPDRHHAYAEGALPFAGESNPLLLGPATARVRRRDDALVLEVDLPAGFDDLAVRCTGLDLQRTRFSSVEFEERDGSPVTLDTDLRGWVIAPSDPRPAGPIAGLQAGQREVVPRPSVER